MADEQNEEPFPSLLYTPSKLVKNNSTRDTAVTVVFYFKTPLIPALGHVFKQPILY